MTMRSQHCDLAVIDVMLPGHDGLWLAEQLRRGHPDTAVVIATAHAGLLAAEAHQRPPADVLIKPFQRERFALAVDRGRQWRKDALGEVRWHAALSLEVRERADAIRTLVRERAVGGISEAQVLSDFAVQRMPDTEAHCERVVRYAESVAREIGIDREAGARLELAARFHDIGKGAMPDALLTKPSAFTPGELVIMRHHVDVGSEILDATRTLAGAAPAVRASHEWFGGGGYPRRLAGLDIPIESRIIAVADSYDAMTQKRAYRVRFDSAEATAELQRCVPAQFDPKIVAAFLSTLGRH